MKGQVFLIGAGPGASDLITVRGVEALRRADVVVHDRLVNRELLQYVRPGAEIIYVGKTPGGPTTRQERINEIIVAKTTPNASETAMYGSRGANGVILITTVRPDSGGHDGSGAGS